MAVLFGYVEAEGYSGAELSLFPCVRIMVAHQEADDFLDHGTPPFGTGETICRENADDRNELEAHRKQTAFHSEEVVSYC